MACFTADVAVGQALWFSVVASPTCGNLAITPAEVFPEILATSCTFEELSISGYRAIVNPIASCCCNCGPTKQSTWGSVKALYR
jgi:hypothetical protein